MPQNHALGIIAKNWREVTGAIVQLVTILLRMEKLAKVRKIAVR